MLWLYDPSWPELLHPFSTAIDSPELPVPEEMVCVLQKEKPAHVRLPEGVREEYKVYGALSIEEWHKQHGHFVE